MKTVLLPFRGEEAGRTAFDVAAVVAGHFGSYLEGLYVVEDPQLPAFGPGIPMSTDYLAELTRQWREIADAARARFVALTREGGIARGELESAGPGPVAGWREIEGVEGEVVASHGRLFDLIVIGRGAGQPGGRWLDTCEAALFESGRPILLVGDRVPSAVGRMVVIAWNGSTETARTVAFAMPFLSGADRVIVLTVTGAMVSGPAGRDLARHLVRNGVNASDVTIETGGRSVGEAIIDRCQDLGADLLVKGAFTRSRLRQIIFGGTTEHILKHAPLPVLMAH
jgi:nucleotide-binding universal stress UspA family protein